MKELIEKIKLSYSSLAMDSLADYYKFEAFKTDILHELEKIQEQENKPFNPLELGFTKDIVRKNSYNKIAKINNYDYRFSLYLTKEKNNWDLIFCPINGFITDSINITLKINSHLEGEIVFKALGVIE